MLSNGDLYIPIKKVDIKVFLFFMWLSLISHPSFIQPANFNSLLFAAAAKNKPKNQMSTTMLKFMESRLGIVLESTNSSRNYFIVGFRLLGWHFICGM
jgi:hypothetical protein